MLGALRYSYRYQFIHKSLPFFFKAGGDHSFFLVGEVEPKIGAEDIERRSECFQAFEKKRGSIDVYTPRR